MKIEDKMAIQELLGRAAYGYDERKLDLLTQCFTEDAVMTVRIEGRDPIRPFEGHQAIMKLMTRSMEKQTDRRLHDISNIFFETEGEESATVVSSLTLQGVENGNIRLISNGYYRDEVVKVGDRWKVRRRHLDLRLPS
ncbi:nuclear transport factor 2 family protein [Neobacillus vireti]|uniref:nuclear transport factor 2 family protein n=1 Tax=Neobacillus vireti TaxID=220686 RepID=UPI002FFE1BC5